MSGDVQPRKRKDKKRKKDELGVEETRGTAAVFGEGDVLMHSQHEHGTGGHWCAKVIFFSLLAILIGLIGLIILENRGLTDLDASAVESRYSGVLEGWLEDAPDDHHDEHTLELTHPDDDEHDESDGSKEHDVEVEDIEQEVEDDQESQDDSEDEALEAEKEAFDEEPISREDVIELDEVNGDDGSDEDFFSPGDLEDDDDFLQQDGTEEDVEEFVDVKSAEAPYEEVEESSERLPADSLAEEEEYERQQEELRREEEQASHEEGGNSFEDEWPDEPSDQHWRQQLDLAEDELHQGSWPAALERASAEQLASSARAHWIKAQSLDSMAEARRDNQLLERAIDAYIELVTMSKRLPDNKLLAVATRAIDRIRFKGKYMATVSAHEALISRFPKEARHSNDLTISYLMANRADLASEVLKETLKKWPDDRVALAHYGFVLKTHYNRVEEAVTYLHKALEGDSGAANEPRFYYHLGDAYLLLGRRSEAHEIHKKAAELGHFLSPAQRSLYNVPRLTARPWWKPSETPYQSLVMALEKSWRDILKEGQAARAMYEEEKEGLRERGEWSQLDLFARGREVPGRCKRAPFTCSIVRTEPAAVGCRRGQIKFSLLEPGTHIRPHVGPTNCRLRMHLGLSNTKGAHLRVHDTTRQWQVGRVLIFDDSFEHEVWHNGTGSRLVLIMDLWHPELTTVERRELPAI